MAGLSDARPELRQWDAPWYKRLPYAAADFIYGPNATAQQTQPVINALGVNNPMNIPAQAQESGEMLGRGVKFGDAATAGIGALGAGLAVMGLGGRGGRVMAPEGKGAVRAAMPEQKPQGITAYHGSPHDFERFDMTKIGTGEGAQAYGHGLYFAENEGVAKSYRNALSGQRFKDGTAFDDANPAHQASAYVSGTKSRDEAITALNDDIAMSRRKMDEAHAQRLLRARGMLERGEPIPELNNGKMYEVRINANADDFLDWDKPLSQQSEKAKSTFYGMLNPDRLPKNATPELVYGHLKPAMAMDHVASARGLHPADKTEVSKALADAGIPGIRYLDQGSRAGAGGSSNYVVFDDKMVEILRKYGLAGLIGAGGAAAGSDANAMPSIPFGAP